jgi:DNA-3-methyladenine glycosylase II
VTVSAPPDYRRAQRHLARRDPVMRQLIRRHGSCGLPAAQHEDHFRALLHAIISQQLSSKAAATICSRFDALFRGRPTPRAVAAMADGTLRGVGISPQKLGYIRDLCAHIEGRELRLNRLDLLPDDAVIVALTAVKGIGRWTAEMFLMFRLHRPDVLPVGDLGILNATQRAYGLRAKPTAEQLIEMGEPWRPYRSVACWYLWASLDN